MFINEKLHLLKDLPFNEYQVFDKQSENKKNHFIKYEVLENFANKLQTYKANLDVSNLLISSRRSVHTSSYNRSKKYSFAVVLRVWDISKDLTIRGDMHISP
jgi:hypothetical protein